VREAFGSANHRAVMAVLVLVGVPVLAASAVAQDRSSGQPMDAAAPTVLTCQGRLLFFGSPAEGRHDVQFRLFDAAEGGEQIGDTITIHDATVSDGRFTVSLDFGADAVGGAPLTDLHTTAYSPFVVVGTASLVSGAGRSGC
jgi:hypothetical protein